MSSIRGAIMGVILIVIAVTLVPTIWDAIYTDALTTSGVNGTTSTLLQLVPLVFVGASILGGIVLAVKT